MYDLRQRHSRTFITKDLTDRDSSPKNLILSFTHPQVDPNLYEYLCSAEQKRRYSEECGEKSSFGALLTSVVFFFPTMEVNGAPKQPGYKLS